MSQLIQVGLYAYSMSPSEAMKPLPEMVTGPPATVDVVTASIDG